MKLRIIPKLEVKGGNLIKGINFDGLKVIGDPCEAAFNYFKELTLSIILVGSSENLFFKLMISSTVK